MERIKVGVIGYGFRGRSLTERILRSDDYHVTAVADSDREVLKAARGEPLLAKAALTEDYEELLARRDVEAVFVMAPQYVHREMTVKAFGAGKHVYCEKPMALTVAECNEMIESSRKAGKVLMIGQQMRYHAHLNKVKELIDNGEIGKPVMLWLNEFRNPFPETMKWAFDKKKSGGLLVEKNCHHFDLFNWFTGSQPVRVFASGGQAVVRKPFGIKSDILDHAWVTIDYACGARASLGICMFAGLAHRYECGVGMHLREIGVAGEKGMLRTEGTLDLDVEVRYADRQSSTLHRTVLGGNVPNPYNGEGNRGILMRFAQCVRENVAPEASGEIGKMAVAVGLAAENAASEKRVVEISEVLE